MTHDRACKAVVEWATRMCAGVVRGATEHTCTRARNTAAAWIRRPLAGALRHFWHRPQSMQRGHHSPSGAHAHTHNADEHTRVCECGESGRAWRVGSGTRTEAMAELMWWERCQLHASGGCGCDLCPPILFDVKVMSIKMAPRAPATIGRRHQQGRPLCAAIASCIEKFRHPCLWS